MTGGGTATGGGSATGGGTATGGGAGTGGGSPTQFTEFARGLVVNETTATATPRPSADFTNLPDDAPVTFSPGFFDGGTN
ncbi:MAG: hypothetical protein DI536_30910 [Archangium gephyra]|uniref:Uncharacterized protein n=1 Tax=Archangium gephyra TaxID=48 RepID=A0A2W5UAP8_9BACT|nr:MAG: hypothetical protein DI536_30910 [Archangium gephyra]